MSDLTFDFNGFQLRTMEIDGEPWFVGKDVCEILGSKNVSESLSRLDVDETCIILNDTLGGKQKMLAVNESGFYALVMSSRKAVATSFRKWVTSVVLPSIRKTGSYTLPQTAKPFDQSTLPPAHIQVASLAKSLEFFGIDTLNPRTKQAYQDLVQNILGVGNQALPGSVDKFFGVVEIAEIMGYSPSINTRSRLGKFLVKNNIEHTQEIRLVNGTQRSVNVYRDDQDTRDCITAFYKSDD